MACSHKMNKTCDVIRSHHFLKEESEVLKWELEFGHIFIGKLESGSPSLFRTLCHLGQKEPLNHNSEHAMLNGYLNKVHQSEMSVDFNFQP